MCVMLNWYKYLSSKKNKCSTTVFKIYHSTYYIKLIFLACVFI